MHGIRRDDLKQRSADDADREAKKISDYKSLLQRLSMTETPEHVLSTCKQVLLMNPESYQTWNLCKRALRSVGPSALGDELMFNIETIKLSPKSYCAWFHRQWLVNEFCTGAVSFDWKHELRLCGKLLQLDSRNFHCWNYRMFVANKFNVPLSSELDFTTEMIYSNFSNYSAWHHRCRLLQSIEGSNPDLFRDTIDADLDLCKSAMYTQPSDQAVWFYAEWLCKRSGAIKQSLVSAVKELDSMEPDKHHLALLFLAKHHDPRYYEKLVVVDPMRTGFYRERM